jgi:hypothetical protein
MLASTAPIPDRLDHQGSFAWRCCRLSDLTEKARWFRAVVVGSQSARMANAHIANAPNALLSQRTILLQSCPPVDRCGAHQDAND